MIEDGASSGAVLTSQSTLTSDGTITKIASRWGSGSVAYTASINGNTITLKPTSSAGGYITIIPFNV